ncbi:hypothetical protein LTR15_011927 [Elasticomyces elasticus]|nr:hypothetical protein LTR15_011927 [Elasticomyces elasticus]
MAQSRALQELDAIIASRKASDEALRQQLDQAYKVADYLKQKLNSLECIIGDLSDGQDVKALFGGYSDDMERSEQIVLEEAARRKSNKNENPKSSANPITEAVDPTTINAPASALQSSKDPLDRDLNRVLQALHNKVGKSNKPRCWTDSRITLKPPVRSGKPPRPDYLVVDILGPRQWDPTALQAMAVLSAYSELTVDRLSRLENILGKCSKARTSLDALAEMLEVYNENAAAKAAASNLIVV